ncbi:MAG: class I SAM-dependent methyltransferase [Candidatus Zixiibacteriota bacterium]|nr:MAG: class I SAM-dependent methyltransferase [candidate division Zixibacteria bacterium]
MQATYSKTIEKPCGFLFARWSAGAKAFELSLPPEKRVIADPYAPYYAGQVGMTMVKAMAVINPSVRKAIALRARFIDDYARQSIEEGYEQVVLLGAGYDSRYLRMSEFHAVRVFELDLESTQLIKKALTRRLLGKLPANVTYVSIDFSRDSVTERLLLAGFQRHKKTLFIWEGVTLFLNEAIIAETLGRIRELGTHNRITFDFVPTELIDDATDYEGNRKLIELCASIKEPLTFGCSPNRMREILTGVGYHNASITSMREANLMYSGSSAIEDSYYFATAETGGSDNGNGLLLSDGSDSDKTEVKLYSASGRLIS